MFELLFIIQFAYFFLRNYNFRRELTPSVIIGSASDEKLTRNFSMNMLLNTLLKVMRYALNIFSRITNKNRKHFYEM